MSNDLITVNYARVLSDPNISALTKMTVMTIQKQQYMTLVEFIRGLSDADLDGLCNQFDRMKGNPMIIQEVILLAEIVASGEGDSALNIDDDKTRYENLDYFIVVVTCESLKRKGLVTMDYTHVTFDPVHRDKAFAKVVE